MRKPNILICPEGTWIKEEDEQEGQLTQPASLKIMMPNGYSADIDEVIECWLRDHKE